eukprot:5534947-Amphidinium_carterae.1
MSKVSKPKACLKGDKAFNMANVYEQSSNVLGRTAGCQPCLLRLGTTIGAVYGMIALQLTCRGPCDIETARAGNEGSSQSKPIEA